jgi:alkylhydroperoxidase/carboxymuconolactone decarboxylase family protein YurZ
LLDQGRRTLTAARTAGDEKEEELSGPKAPTTHRDFVGRFPEIGRAWERASQAALKGPLDERSVRLVKLAIAIGAMREGAVHSSVRKARAAGVSADEMYQVLALAATTIGFPSTVAAFSWVRDLTKAARRPRRR